MTAEIALFPDMSAVHTKVDPSGGDLFVEINRGVNCAIAKYEVSIGGEDADDKSSHRLACGVYPTVGNLRAPAPLVKLGRPTNLANKRVVVDASCVAISGHSNQFDITVGLFQGTGDTRRRIAWQAASSVIEKFVIRFEIKVTSRRPFTVSTV